MKIVDRATFLALPAGTIYAKFGDGKEPRAYTFDRISIKDEARGENDWWHTDLTPHPVDCADSFAWIDWIDGMLGGGLSGSLDLDTVSADGLFGAAQLFAVYDRSDIEGLIVRLQRALAEQEVSS